MLIELESVGCVFDTEKQTVHTMFFLGGYDKENGFDVDKCEDDFYGNLSEQDIDLIKENCKFDIDKKINSPYNTYINTGLPPGPISLTYTTSIESVLNADSNNYLFFCAKTKSQLFSNKALE